MRREPGDPQGMDEYRVVLESNASGRSPYRLVGGDGSEVTVVNDFLDTHALRDRSKQTLRTYAYCALSLWKWQVMEQMERAMLENR